jgi:hypothetical protein
MPTNPPPAPAPTPAEGQLAFAIAQLRHAYAQLVGHADRDPR